MTAPATPPISSSIMRALYGGKKAAEQGCSNAQYCLGRMYRYGHGVKQDAMEAFKWFKLAAEQGDTTAQSYLAMLH